MRSVLALSLSALALIGLPNTVLAKAKKAKPVAVAPVVQPALSVEEQAVVLRDQALRSNIAYAWLSELTTRFGPRPAGSESEHKAAAWAAAGMKAMGFDNVRIETFPLSIWKRGEEQAEIVGPYPQKLVVTALGGSSSTPPEGIEAETVIFDTYNSFLDSNTDVKGKIVVVLQPTARTQTGEGYGVNSGSVRREGPIKAKERGAVAFMMRALGTEDHRFTHTGATRFQTEDTAIPALAMSPPDAENMKRMQALSEQEKTGPLRIRLKSTPVFLGEGYSQNVIGEITGTEFPNEIITIGGHMDSWDLGTGAIDDGAGMAITLAAAKAIKDSGMKPKRTIRVVLYGAEEVSQPNNKGLSGGNAYANAYVGGTETHIVTAESDFGADIIYKASMPLASDPNFNRTLGKVLYPIKIYIDPKPSEGGGPDTSPAQHKGVPVFDLQQSGTDYFDVHHTADDVLDRVVPAKLDQNVAAWAATIWLIANTHVTFTMPKKD